MSVTLGALVVAISTEFSVLLSQRYRQERIDGFPVAEALARTYRSTGVAVAASGATAIAGFAVLVVSDIRMLRDFGFVTVVDLDRVAARRAPRPAGGARARRAGRAAVAARAGVATRAQGVPERLRRLRRPRAART